MTHEKIHVEEFRVKGDEMVAKVKEIVHEGNVRRLTIKNEDGKTLVEMPLTVGVLGVLLLPMWAALGAIAALVADCTISVEKVVVKESDKEPETMP